MLLRFASSLRKPRVRSAALRRSPIFSNIPRRSAAPALEVLEQRRLLTAALAAQPVNFVGPVIEGTYRGPVDVFSDDRANAKPEDFSAAISWGDGSPVSAGTVVASGGGEFEVEGSHVYRAGTYRPTVAIADDVAGLDVTAALPPSADILHVLDGSLVGEAIAIAPLDGVPFNAALASFRDSSTLSQASDFTALIDWGDGTPDSAGVVSGGDGQFSISGGHTYAHRGDSVPTVRVASSEGESLVLSGPAGWKSAAPMPTARVGLAAVTGPDGRIYVLGGVQGGSVEIYDPASDVWSAAAPMPTPRTGLAAAAGLDGRIYALVGIDYQSDSLDVAVYDPSTNAWSAAAPMLSPRSWLAAATGTDGRIYALGGMDNRGAVLDSVEAYDPATNAWSTVAPMPTARANLAAVTGPDGRIYALGGVDANGDTINTVEAYDPTTNTWTTVAPMPTPRDSLAAVTGRDGRIYALGGHSDNTLSSVDVYDPTTNSWSAGAPMPKATVYFAAATDLNGGIHAFGGTAFGEADVGNLNLTLAPAPPSAIPNIVAAAPDLSLQKGVLFEGAAASFSDSDQSLNSDNFAAMIDWGDGSASVGRISGAAGSFTVNGEHVYQQEGPATVSVKIVDTLGGSATARGTVQVAEQIPVVAGRIAVGDDTSFNGTVAVFSDPDARGDAAQFTATIDWGEPWPSAGSIRVAPDGTFIVSGSYIWPGGNFTHSLVTITIHDADGASGVAKTTAQLVGPNERYADEAAQQLRDVPMDVMGQVYWAQRFVQGTPRTELTELLVHDFHYFYGLLRTTYQQLLGRPIDDAGEGYWSQRMHDGLTDEQLQVNLLVSPEFYRHAGGSNADWIEAMYEALLGRQADAGGMTYWLSELNLGMAPSAAASVFVTSAEHAAQVVRDDYMTYLGRQAGPDEVHYWTAEFLNGMTDEDIIAQIVASDEYFKSHSS